jgi:3-deoxy-D-manno-octulosonate 8-phosphate phosphatase (KDO 8-P phosphatase)
VGARTPRAPGNSDTAERAARVRLLALDVDGTMTDGTLYIGPDAEAMKGFSVRDGFGLALLREAGLRIAIVTARKSSIVATRAAELRFDALMQGAADKGEALRALAAEFGITLDEIAYMGDDWPDLPALAIAGLAAAPADAAEPVLTAAHWVASRPAGHGAVREFAEWLLESRGLLAGLLEAHRGGPREPRS